MCFLWCYAADFRTLDKGTFLLTYFNQVNNEACVLARQRAQPCRAFPLRQKYRQTVILLVGVYLAVEVILP